MDPLSALVIAATLTAVGFAMRYLGSPSSSLGWRPANRSEVARFGFPPSSIFRGLIGPRYWKTELDGFTLVLGAQKVVERAEFRPTVANKIEWHYWLGIDGADLLPPQLCLTFQADLLGNHPLVTALLGDGFCTLIDSDYGTIDGGRLSISLQRAHELHTIDELAAGLITAVRRAGAARQGDTIDVLSLLADNMDAAAPEVRERSLRVLLVQFPDEQHTQDALKKGKADNYAGVRLLAAARENDRGALEEIVADRSASESVRKKALLRLHQSFADDRTVELTMQVLSSGKEDLVRAALQQLWRIGSVDVSPIVELAKRFSGSLAAEALHAIERIEGERAEQILVEFLSHRDLEVRVAAADALGRVGTIASVEPLRREESVFAPGELSIALTTAIDLIQSRASATKGTLSLADGETGGLSILGTAGGLSDPEG